MAVYTLMILPILSQGFPGGSDSKESACNARDLGSIPQSRRSPGEGNGYPLLYSCLENPMDAGAWRAGLESKSQTLLSDLKKKKKDILSQRDLLLFNWIGVNLTSGP